MNNSKLIWRGLLHAAAVAVYVAIVASILQNGEKWFGQLNGILGPLLVLLLLTLSVAVVGSLIFIRPALWALNGNKKEALNFLFWTLAWLALIVVYVFIVIAAMK